MHDTGSTGVLRGKTLLVTGATGFIGGHLVRAARSLGCRVRALVRDRRRAAHLEPVELFEGDLLRPECLDGIAEGIDLVVHGASLLGKWRTDETLLYDVNVQGTVNLLQRFEHRDLERFIHLSAGGVSGPAAAKQVDETYPCRPATAYEKSKWIAERRVLELSSELGVPATVVRPTFTYGPGDPHKLALFVAVKRGRYAFIGDGDSVNHPVYIDDLVQGILLALARGRNGEVYIIGGESPVTKRELVYAIADAMGVRRPSIRIPVRVARWVAPAMEVFGRTLGFEPILTRSRVMMMADNFGYSIEKARRELGYRPRMALREGIERTARSYVEAGLL